MAYSEDLRKKVIEYMKEGHTQEEAAKTFHISRTAIKEWKKKYKETGNLKRKELKRPFKKIDPEKLKPYVKEHADAYLKEIAEVFGCSGTSVRRALIRLKITRKKRSKHTADAARKNGRSSRM